MPSTFQEVTRYQVAVFAAPKAGYLDAYISLRSENLVGACWFLREGQALPANRKATLSSGSPYYILYYRYSQMSDLVDLLRNEKPIYLFFRDEDKLGYLTTSAEPVGEEELM